MYIDKFGVYIFTLFEFFLNFLIKISHFILTKVGVWVFAFVYTEGPEGEWAKNSQIPVLRSLCMVPGNFPIYYKLRKACFVRMFFFASFTTILKISINVINNYYFFGESKF